MARLRVLPTGDFSVAITRNGAATNFDCVNDAPTPIQDTHNASTNTHDDDSTYLSSNSDTYTKDMYTFDAPVFPFPSKNVSITKVGVVAWVKGTGGVVSTPRIIENLRIDGVDYTKNLNAFNFSIYNSFAEDNTWGFATNPKTGNLWSVDDVTKVGSNAITHFGIEFSRTTSPANEVRCTQVYLLVKYETHRKEEKTTIVQS